MAKSYIVGNPRGIPNGVRILALAPRCKPCDGSGGETDSVCEICNGQGSVLESEWFEGDAIEAGAISKKAWTAYVAEGLIVEASDG